MVNNSDYTLLPSYGSTVIVPKTVTDEQLAAVAKFRSRARIPILCWVDPATRAVLVRCDLAH